MNYLNMERAIFLERPNRFIAYVETAEGKEICHVKNTGRCRELLLPGAVVYVSRNTDPKRKTQLDLICVEKQNQIESDGVYRLVNMDSQAPNAVVKEFLESGELFPKGSLIRPEFTYGKSRFDFYVEAGERKAFIEVKGVTLERNGAACFPDAPTERGVKHIRELIELCREGYETYLIFVLQMKPIRCLYPNDRTHREFGEALREAMHAGVHVLAYDCEVEMDSLKLKDPVPVYPDEETARLSACVDPLRNWFAENARVLPWRERPGVFKPSPYEIWVSEIMLQQTRVEAVRGYYARFMEALPDIEHLAAASEEELLKLWEGLGYYNRIRNMQKAAKQILEEYDGEFPKSYEAALKLSGIGSYTAGAILSNAYDLPIPAVDGNVLRVVSRLLASDSDIADPKVKKQMEERLLQVIPTEKPGLFNQALMELGACVCVPNGKADCAHCPLEQICLAHRNGLEETLPVKAAKKARRVEKRTILLVRNGREVLITRRPEKGLLAGLYEFINLPGHLSEKEAAEAVKELGLEPLYVEKLDKAKHIFSHVEWHMEGYMIRVAEPTTDGYLFAETRTVQEKYAIPSAYRAYTERLTIRQGKDAL